MEPIVAPLQVEFARSSALPTTIPSGTLVFIVKKTARASGRLYGKTVCTVVEDAELTTAPSNVYLGNYVQPPNCINARRDTVDIINFKHMNSGTEGRVAILADPLILRDHDYEHKTSDNKLAYMNSVHISATVGGVTSLAFDQGKGNRLTLRAEDQTAVAGADVYLTMPVSTSASDTSDSLY